MKYIIYNDSTKKVLQILSEMPESISKNLKCARCEDVPAGKMFVVKDVLEKTETIEKEIENKKVSKENRYLACTLSVVEDKTNGKIKNIKALKDNLTKYKYDIEQVELFGMIRNDYNYKKQQCREIIEQLRNLET